MTQPEFIASLNADQLPAFNAARDALMAANSAQNAELAAAKDAQVTSANDQHAAALVEQAKRDATIKDLQTQIADLTTSLADRAAHQDDLTQQAKSAVGALFATLKEPTPEQSSAMTALSALLVMADDPAKAKRIAQAEELERQAAALRA